MKEFSAVSIKPLDKSNGGYHHQIKGVKLFLRKGDVKMELNADEVMEMLYALGFNAEFKKYYKCGL